jgi:hypothetical protein
VRRACLACRDARDHPGGARPSKNSPPGIRTLPAGAAAATRGCDAVFGVPAASALGNHPLTS